MKKQKSFDWNLFSTIIIIIISILIFFYLVNHHSGGNHSFESYDSNTNFSISSTNPYENNGYFNFKIGDAKRIIALECIDGKLNITENTIECVK